MLKQQNQTCVSSMTQHSVWSDPGPNCLQRLSTDDTTGFIQGSLSKIQGLLKDFKTIYGFQGLKV